MLRILEFLVCIALAIAAPDTNEANIDVGGRFSFEGNGPDIFDQSKP
jgi:hypothetical protein